MTICIECPRKRAALCAAGCPVYRADNGQTLHAAGTTGRSAYRIAKRRERRYTLRRPGTTALRRSLNVTRDQLDAAVAYDAATFETARDTQLLATDPLT
jgi:hypothetical protein